MLSDANASLPLRRVAQAAPDQIARRLSRRDGGESDAIGGRDAAYHADVAAAFARFARSMPSIDRAD